jgi:hypothetical protein
MTFSPNVFPRSKGVGDLYAEPSAHARATRVRAERAFKWVLRVTLPAAFIVCVLAIYWVSFDGMFEHGKWRLLSAAPIAFTGFGVGFWTWRIWLSGNVF